jgi:eukaryotic-like serine/threonine-protein kinase
MRLRALLAIVVVAASVCAGTLSYASAVVMPRQFGQLKVAPGPRPGSFALRWAAAPPPTGSVFDVQVRYSGTATWTDLAAGTTALGQTFTPLVPGPYALRARLRNATNGHSSNWSPTLTLTGNWSMFQNNQQHTGVTPDPTIGATTAARLTLKWKQRVAVGDQLFSSPAVAFNRQLHKPLAYATTSAGTITARDLATGAVVWTAAGNGPIVSSPAVLGNSVYVGTEGHYLLALDATTGQLQCAFSQGGAVISSPVVGHVDSTGPVVFFGDVEANNGGHEWAVNGVGNSHGACTRKWIFNGWNNTGAPAGRTGSWSPPALTTDSTGRPLLVFGSSDPDDSVYALDARNGRLAWRFQTNSTHPDEDVGAAPTISRPGLNGFAHGVVYIDAKNNIEYALDLLTGTPIWKFDLQKNAGGATATAQSAAALIGSQVIVPYAHYLFSLNAATGAQTWRSGPAAGDYFSSPSVSGAPGDQVILIGDDAGVEHAYRLRDGASVLQLKTGSAIYSSDAVAYGSVLFGTTSGDLYALG